MAKKEKYMKNNEIVLLQHNPDRLVHEYGNGVDPRQEQVKAAPYVSELLVDLTDPTLRKTITRAKVTEQALTRLGEDTRAEVEAGNLRMLVDYVGTPVTVGVIDSPEEQQRRRDAQRIDTVRRELREMTKK